MTEPLAELTPEDVLAVHRLREVTVTGNNTLFVVHASLDTNATAPASDIWIAPQGGTPRRLTSGPWLDSLPRPCPNGRRLAFTSDRNSAGLFALFVVDLDESSDDARQLGTFAGTVEQISWATDGSHLLVLTADPGAETGSAFGGRAVGADHDADAVAVVRRPRQAWRRLHRVDVDTGRSCEIGPRNATVWEFCWNGSGPLVAVVSDDPSESGWFDARVVALDPETRTAQLVYRPQWQVQGVDVSFDSRRLAFVEAPQSDRGLLAGQVVVIDLEDLTVTRPELDVDVTRLRWTADGRLFWTGVASVRTACGFVVLGREPAVEPLIDEHWRGLATLGAIEMYQADCSDDGSLIAAVVESLGRPPEVCVLDHSADDGWRPLTTFNGAFTGRPHPTQVEYSWRSRDGLFQIEGLLLLPLRYDSKHPLPLVIWVHGGPTNAHTSLFAPAVYAGEALMLTQRGCAVLLPNPRGSTGRGVAYMQANIGDLGGGDFNDLLDAVTSLAQDGIIDPKRVGIAGASYGGFMSAWASVRTDVFAAAVPLSSITNWLSHRYTSELSRFDDIYLAGDPRNANGPYLDRSPIMYARGARTPTLLIHGEADRSCPVGQGQELFQALAEDGCETELAIYPGEGHEICEHRHVLDVCGRVVAWFSLHLGLSQDRH
jgi:dipeptidyl aminopeptidase/acylaminoacyl peptidase